MKIGVLGALIGLAAATAAVAAEAPLTLIIEPRVAPIGAQRVSLSGSLLSGRAGQEIAIEAKECGAPAFVVVRRERTEAGGAWHTEMLPAVKTSYRAVWRNARTPAIEVLRRPLVRLEQEDANRFSVLIVAMRFFRGAKGRLERFERATGSWILVRRVTLSRRSAPRGASWAYTGADFTSNVRRGALVRFVLPRDQAAPCYLAGHSVQFNVRP